MKITTTLVAIAFSLCVAQAGSVIFRGEVTDTANTSLPLHVGDSLTAHVAYNSRSGLINRVLMQIGGLEFNYSGDGLTGFIHLADPCPNEYVSYQIYQLAPGPLLLLQLFAYTPDCVVPPISGFALNEFTFLLDGQTFGRLTEIPEVHP